MNNGQPYIDSIPSVHQLNCCCMLGTSHHGLCFLVLFFLFVFTKNPFKCVSARKKRHTLHYSEWNNSLQNYPFGNQDTVIPPGHYAYTNNFPQTMKTLSPTYTIPTESVFFDHLLMNSGKTIIFVTNRNRY